MSKVRVITPIISEGFRDDAPLRECLPESCILSQVYLSHGPASVESAVDEILAGPGVIDAALVAEADGMEAVVIDCMLDPALDAAREMVSIPVLGCGETSLSSVKNKRFSIVTVLQRQERNFKALVASYGLTDQLVSVRGIGVSVLALEEDRASSILATIREVKLAIEEDKAEIIVFGCTGMLGFDKPVAAALGLDPACIIDPLPNAVKIAHEQASKGAGTDKLRYPAPEPKRVIGFDVWPRLTNKMMLEE